MPQEQDVKNRESRPPREGQGQGRGPREGGGGPRRDDRDRPRGGGDDRRGGDRPRFDGPPEIELEKLISDSLYLDNQAHGVVSRMRDMDSGTKSQLRRLYNAVRRAYRSAENERQHEFVMRVWRTLSRGTVCAAWTRSKSCCCKSPAKTMRADTNVSRICSRPSWPITSKKEA